MDAIRGDALRGHLENLVLAALGKGDAHGFEILKRLEEAGSGALKLKEGSLYPALYRLERAGLVKGSWEAEETSERAIGGAGGLTGRVAEERAGVRAFFSREDTAS